MQYLLLIYRSDAEYSRMAANDRKEMSAEYGAFTQSIIQSAISRPATACSRQQRQPPCGSATARS